MYVSASKGMHIARGRQVSPLPSRVLTPRPGRARNTKQPHAPHHKSSFFLALSSLDVPSRQQVQGHEGAVKPFFKVRRIRISFVQEVKILGFSLIMCTLSYTLLRFIFILSSVDDDTNFSNNYYILIHSFFRQKTVLS